MTDGHAIRKLLGTTDGHTIHKIALIADGYTNYTLWSDERLMVIPSVKMNCDIYHGQFMPSIT
jgi:hypothetical protein